MSDVPSATTGHYCECPPEWHDVTYTRCRPMGGDGCGNETADLGGVTSSPALCLPCLHGCAP